MLPRLIVLGYLVVQIVLFWMVCPWLIMLVLTWGAFWYDSVTQLGDD